MQQCKEAGIKEFSHTNAQSLYESHRYDQGKTNLQIHATAQLKAAGMDDGSVTGMNAISKYEKHKYDQGKNGLNKVNDAKAERNAENGVEAATLGNTVQVFCKNRKCSKSEQRVTTTQMISREVAERDLTESTRNNV